MGSFDQFFVGDKTNIYGKIGREKKNMMKQMEKAWKIRIEREKLGKLHGKFDGKIQKKKMV